MAEDNIKDSFYNQLSAVLSSVPPLDILAVLYMDSVTASNLNSIEAFHKTNHSETPWESAVTSI